MPGQRLLLLILALGLFLAAVQFELITVAFEKLGLTRDSAILLLLFTLFGSLVNVPMFSMASELQPSELPPAVRRIFRFQYMGSAGRTLVTANLGGCVIPLAFCVFLLAHFAIPLSAVLLAVTVVAGFSYAFSRPVPGLGIALPVFIAPLSAVAIAGILDTEYRPALAYIAGTLGVLIGADLLRLKDIRRLGLPVASIGGAGTFDGVFMAGVVAVLLT
jgi:uncharacterized membrane protein